MISSIVALYTSISCSSVISSILDRRLTDCRLRLKCGKVNLITALSTDRPSILNIGMLHTVKHVNITMSQTFTPCLRKTTLDVWSWIPSSWHIQVWCCVSCCIGISSPWARWRQQNDAHSPGDCDDSWTAKTSVVGSTVNVDWREIDV